MKQLKYLPKFRLNEKNKNTIYTGGPVNKGFYERNLLKAKPIYLNNCCKTPKKFFRRKQDKAFNQLINNYFEDYNKFQKAHKFNQKKPLKRQESEIDYNQYELKRKNLSIMFFNYDLINNENEEANFDITDNLINSMFTGKDDTLIKTTQIRNDYEMRLNGNKFKEPEPKYNNFIDDMENNKKDINKEKEKDKYSLKRENIQFKEEVSSGDQSSNIKNRSKTIKEEKEKKNKEKEEDENIFYLEGGDLLIDDNYLEFSNNIYLDPNLHLFKDIINSNFKDEYTAPIYNVPQSAIDEKEKEKQKREEIQKMLNSQKNQELNKYEGGELKRFKDMIISNKYPGFEQIINPYYPTDYIPPPCFPKLPEDEEEEENEEYGGYNDFGFNENENKETIEEDDNALKLLSNEITNDEYPMFEHLIRNDFKGNYVPPIYKIPSYIQKDIEKEKEEKEKQKKEYEENKKLNVANTINQYENKELKMMDNIIKDDKYPLFEQLINPFYPTNYIAPDVFPKPENLEEDNEEEYYGQGDFEMTAGRKVEGNNDNEVELFRNKLLNEEYPMFEHLIRNDFKGNYAPPIYKMPDFMEDKKEDLDKKNRQNFETMKGNYVNYDEYQGNELPMVNQMINNNYEENKNEENKIEENKNEEKKENIKEENDEDDYNDFEIIK